MYMVLTNNPKITEIESIRLKKVNIKIIESSSREIVWMAQEMLFQNWDLIADPVGGRLAHPNPFISLLIKKSSGKNGTVASTDRLERLLRMYREQEGRFSTMLEEEVADLALMDYELIRASLCQAMGDGTQ